MVELSPHTLALELLSMHTHAELCRPEEIVYREADIVRLLVALGQPKPDFDGVARSKKFLGAAYPPFQSITQKDKQAVPAKTTSDAQ